MCVRIRLGRPGRRSRGRIPRPAEHQPSRVEAACGRGRRLDGLRMGGRRGFQPSGVVRLGGWCRNGRAFCSGVTRPAGTPPGDNGPQPWAAVARGWNRGRIRPVLTETPMNSGVFRCIRVRAARAAGIRRVNGPDAWVQLLRLGIPFDHTGSHSTRLDPSRRDTRPRSPSTRSRSPAAIRRIASGTLTTAGRPNSRATTAPCDR